MVGGAVLRVAAVVTTLAHPLSCTHAAAASPTGPDTGTGTAGNHWWLPPPLTPQPPPASPPHHQPHAPHTPTAHPAPPNSTNACNQRLPTPRAAPSPLPPRCLPPPHSTRLLVLSPPSRPSLSSPGPGCCDGGAAKIKARVAQRATPGTGVRALSVIDAHCAARHPAYTPAWGCRAATYVTTLLMVSRFLLEFNFPPPLLSSPLLLACTGQLEAGLRRLLQNWV